MPSEEKWTKEDSKAKQSKMNASRPIDAASLHDKHEITKKSLSEGNISKNEKLSHFKMTKRCVIPHPIRTTLSIKKQRDSLPFFKLKEQFLEAFTQNQILIVIGETGSGKSTQMTQYLAELTSTNRFQKIGCTQPRRVAAQSVAKHVAKEYGCRLGEEVGYAIRFDHCSSHKTLIEYMTDGILLKESAMDPNLNDFSVIILDEAHERALNIDILFGLLKAATQRRGDLKLIVTSATLNADKFSSYFFNAPIFTVPGRMFPVEMIYVEKTEEQEAAELALQIVEKIHSTEPSGDILVFLAGQDEINRACEQLGMRMKQEVIIHPLYAALPFELQTRIFEPTPPGKRKVVIATNIAETSITIDGIRYVVDAGRVKQMTYNTKTGIYRLRAVDISQAQAEQRKGRAGRTGPGKCFRLYTEEALKKMSLTTLPEVQCSNLVGAVLQLKATGVDDIFSFDFMDAPSEGTLLDALSQLHSIGALNDNCSITRLGLKMAEFPLDPMLAKMLFMSVQFGCSAEMLTIVAILSGEKIFYRPKDNLGTAALKKARFDDAKGDHLTLLEVYNSWRDNNYSESWCSENFLQWRILQTARDVRRQLQRIMEMHRLDVISCGDHMTKIRKAICSACFANAAAKVANTKDKYATLPNGSFVYMRTTCSMFNDQPAFVIFDKTVATEGRPFMTDVTKVKRKWLDQLTVSSYKFTWHEKSLNFKFAGPERSLKLEKRLVLEPVYKSKGVKQAKNSSEKQGSESVDIHFPSNPQGTKRVCVSELDQEKDIQLIQEGEIDKSKDAPVHQAARLLAELSIKDQPELPPISELKDYFLELFGENRVLIVIGETGSGKTTKMTQYLAEAGYASESKRIACTQSMRRDTISVAKRVAQEYGCSVGEQVGYTVRFDNCTSSKTIIEYIEEELLVEKITSDEDLNGYSVIILDEAHERSINIDILFALLKASVQRRKDLKLIISSATMNATKFSPYFSEASVLTIFAQIYPVEVIYAAGSTKKNPNSFKSALQIVEQIHSTQPPGDILFFVTSHDDIQMVCGKLDGRIKASTPELQDLIIVPVHNHCPFKKQSSIFKPTPPGKRKVVVVDSSAETSFTIDGICYVVDTGYSKLMTYDIEGGVNRLKVAAISQEQAEIRRSKAGRTWPGKCYRLYTKETFEKMPPTPVIEVRRSNLARAVLKLKAFGINEIDLMDAPPVESSLNALSQLHCLGAIDDDGSITTIGKIMSVFPLEPMLAKMLIVSADLGCSEEMLTIVAMLHAENSFYRPRDKFKKEATASKKAHFDQVDGDHFTLLKLYNSWRENHSSNSWCSQNYLQSSSLKEASKIREQLLKIMLQEKLGINSCGNEIIKVQRAICSSCFLNSAARKNYSNNYSTLIDGTVMHLQSISSLYDDPPELLIFYECTALSKRAFMSQVLRVERDWLTDFTVSTFELVGPEKSLKVTRHPLFRPTESTETFIGTVAPSS